MRKDAKYRAECLDAWNKFDPNPYVHTLKINIIPPKPRAEDIENFGKEIHDRKFRPIVPRVVKDQSGDIWFEGYESLEKEDAFLKKLSGYRKNGYWFYNRDKLEWITGDHWYALNVMRIMSSVRDPETGLLRPKRNLPNFLDAQQHLFWAWEEALKSRYVSGLLILGPRRLGKSLCGYATILNRATRTYDVNFTMQAQNRDLVKILYKTLVDIWENMPPHPYFMPPYDTKTQGGLHLIAPAKVGKKDYILKRNEESLNTHILHGTNKSSKFDGAFAMISFLDEISKWDNQDINETVGTMAETLKMGGLEPVGKMYSCTTAENIGGKTLEPFTRLYKASNSDKRDKLGVTPSGLLGIFISGAMGYRHDPVEDGDLPERFSKPTVDEWGYSDIEAATAIHEYMRSIKKGDEKIKWIRMYPLTEDEPLIIGTTACAFDSERLNDQLIYNDKTRVLVKEPVVQGRFEWVPGREWREAYFTPSNDGHHFLSWMPEPQDRNKLDFSGYLLKPLRNNVALGVDPFSHKYHEDKKFSKGAIASLCLGYPLTHPEIGFVHIYNHRPESPQAFLAEVMKAAMFFSSSIYIENQKNDIYNMATERGLQLFFEKDPMNLHRKNAGISTRGDEYRISLINGLMQYITDHVGRVVGFDKNMDEIISYGDCPFDDLIKDWLKFDSQKWTKYDLTVASMLALCALRKPAYAPFVGTRNFSDYF